MSMDRREHEEQEHIRDMNEKVTKAVHDFLNPRAINTDMLAALHAIADGLADTGSTPGKRMTLITKADACALATVAIAKAEGAP